MQKKLTELSFSRSIAKHLNSSGYIAKTEINSGYGIADVVAIKLNSNNVKLRLSYGQTQKLMNEGYFKVLSVISDNVPISENEIILNSKLSESYVKHKILKELLEYKYIKLVGDKIYIKVNGWAPIKSEIIAIESKLSDWQRGITQAIRYKSYADKTYLALPYEHVKNVDKSELKKHNIGLISIYNNELIFLFKPVIQKKLIVPSKLNFVCEYFWSGRRSLKYISK